MQYKTIIYPIKMKFVIYIDTYNGISDIKCDKRIQLVQGIRC